MNTQHTSHSSSIGVKSSTGLMLNMNQGEVQTEGDHYASFGKRLDWQTQYGSEGIFVEWSWDGKQLKVCNDRYGIYPLYYAASGPKLLVSNSLLWILQRMDSVEINKEAVAIFLRLWQYIGNDTPFSGVQILPANSELIWEKGQINIRQKSVQISSSAWQQLSYHEAVDTYIQLFASAITRRIPPDGAFTVPITGGRDSRHILLELYRQQTLPSECVTLLMRPPASQEDVRVAGLLTEALGIRHRVIPRPESFLDTIEADIHLTQYCGGSHTWAPPLAKSLVGRYHTVYDGLAGSILSSGFMVDKERADFFARGDLNKLALVLLSGNEKRIHRELKHEWLNDYPLELAANRLTIELAKHVDAPNPMMSYLFWNRTRRSVGLVPFGILSKVPVVHCPYLDHELFDFLFSINPDHYLKHHFHDDVIRRAYPEFAFIPYEDKLKKGLFDADARQYYRRAIRGFVWRYLMSYQPPGKPLQRSYLLQKALYDHLRPAVTSPWYLPTPIYVNQLLRVVFKI